MTQSVLKLYLTIGYKMIIINKFIYRPRVNTAFYFKFEFLFLESLNIDELAIISIHCYTKQL